MPAQGDGLPPRESMDFDAVVVGAGPAGLATAIRLKQRAAEQGGDVSVVVVEKGSEVGAHILSGLVIDPVGLDRLLPGWREDPDRPLKTEVTKDEFLFLSGPRGGIAPADQSPCPSSWTITATSSARSAMSAATSAKRPRRRSGSRSIRASPPPRR